jgi:hypothetical protein
MAVLGVQVAVLVRRAVLLEQAVLVQQIKVMQVVVLCAFQMTRLHGKVVAVVAVLGVLVLSIHLRQIMEQVALVALVLRPQLLAVQ